MRRGHDRAQMVAAALVEDLDLGAGQGRLDQALDLGQIGHVGGYPATSPLARGLEHLARRGRASRAGGPAARRAACSGASIACQPT